MDASRSGITAETTTASSVLPVEEREPAVDVQRRNPVSDGAALAGSIRLDAVVASSGACWRVGHMTLM